MQTDWTRRRPGMANRGVAVLNSATDPAGQACPNETSTRSCEPLMRRSHVDGTKVPETPVAGVVKVTVAPGTRLPKLSLTRPSAGGPRDLPAALFRSPSAAPESARRRHLHQTRRHRLCPVPELHRIEHHDLSPRSRSSRTVSEPMKPAPPVTKTAHPAGLTDRLLVAEKSLTFNGPATLAPSLLLGIKRSRANKIKERDAIHPYQHSARPEKVLWPTR
jgi:hypothetical protein